MKPTASLIYVFKGAFGGADAFAPVAAELAEYHRGEVRLDLVFLDGRSRAEVAASPFHDLLFAESGTVWDLSTIPGRTIAGRLAKLWTLLRLLLARRLQCRKVNIIFPVSGKTGAERALLALFRMFGTHGFFPGTQTPWSEAMVQRALHTQEMRQLESIKVRRSAKPPQLYFCYVEQEIPLIRRARNWPSRILPVGIPRLLPGWRKAIARLGPTVLANEFRNLGWPEDTPAVATFILTNADALWFDSPQQYWDMLEEGIRTVRRHFPEIPIVLKAKPKFAEAMADFERRLNDPRIKISTLALAAFASITKIALTVNESSAIFEFVVTSTPVIEYGYYSKSWVSTTGSGSAWTGTPGLVYVETSEALDAAVRSVAEGTFCTIGDKELENWFGSRKDFSKFLN